jgi:hypothetical protein
MSQQFAGYEAKPITIAIFIENQYTGPVGSALG